MQSSTLDVVFKGEYASAVMAPRYGISGVDSIEVTTPQRRIYYDATPMPQPPASSDSQGVHPGRDDGLSAALRYLRTAPHRPAGRSVQAKAKALATIELIRADAILTSFEGPDDASENLDSYIYGTGQ